MRIFFSVQAYGRLKDLFFRLLKEGWKPEQAKSILPLAVKCDAIATGFASDWEKLIKAAKSELEKQDAQISEIMDPLYAEFVKRKFISKIE